MKSLISVKLFLALCLGVVGSGFPVRAADTFVVHEWGTFTSVSGSDGVMLPGLEVEEERLPNFVHSFSEVTATSKGLNHPVKNVTVKMETPVLYFYAAEPLTAQIEVGFHGGSISQWYPDRVGGETLPASVDFAIGYNGSAMWKVEVLAKGSAEKITAPTAGETTQWPRARVAEANRVRGPKGEVEGFIFYRGVGNFHLPLEVKAAPDGTLTLHNAGGDDIAFAWVYEVPGKSGERSHAWWGKLTAGGTTTVAPDTTDASARMKIPFHAALCQAGLSAAEATALMDTWRESYFARPGLRIFWIVPRAFTDKILPISIMPRPDKLERVLVGRSELLTPSFEKELVEGFRSDGGARWANDRYFLAYRERARQLGVVLPVNTP